MVPTMTVLAVAIGLTAVGEGTHQVRVNPAAVAKAVGRYVEEVDARGTAHLRGFDRRTGQPFDVRIAPSGHVEATVGNWVYTFEVATGG
jgi:hypothetical protein